MSRGYDENQARLAALSGVGRSLARRSKSCCEMCGASGVPLAPWEVPPVPVEPMAELCVFACEACRTQMDDMRRLDPERWRFLSATVWSDLPAVQVAAVRMLHLLAPGHRWAEELLEQVYLDEEVEAWVEKAL
jgi:protein PhnA